MMMFLLVIINDQDNNFVIFDFLLFVDRILYDCQSSQVEDIEIDF